MAKGVREFLGAQRDCSVCGHRGRERNFGTTQAEADDTRQPKHWVCSADCAEKLMEDLEWTSFGWIK